MRRNLLVYSDDQEPETLIVAPKGYTVAVSHGTLDGFKRISIFRDDMRHCQSINVMGRVSNLLPTEDGRAICGWVTQGDYRFFMTIELENSETKPTPYIPVKEARK